MKPVPNIADSADVRADRSLLLPGPLPPLSHLGATLLRHSVHAALRYALYQLGQAVPESPPTRFVALRLYLDAPVLRKAVGTAPASEEVLGALLNPGGKAVEPLPGRLRGVLWFHRARLRARGVGDGIRTGKWFSRSPKPAPPVRAQLSALLPALGDALLGDVIAALDRRRARAEGKDVARAQSLQASRFLESARSDLSRLGLPDPMVASWRDSVPPVAHDPSATNRLTAYRHRLRGGFREQYRYLLDRLRPSFLALGDRAVTRGHLASREDIFFLPLDLLDDVGGESKPSWLDQAVASNREEWLEVRGRKAPADTLGNIQPSSRLDLPDDLVPLWPLV